MADTKKLVVKYGKEILFSENAWQVKQELSRRVFRTAPSAKTGQFEIVPARLFTFKLTAECITIPIMKKKKRKKG